MHKAALFYVEQTVPLHPVLLNVLAQMLLMVSCVYAYQFLLCFVQGQGKRTIEKAGAYAAFSAGGGGCTLSLSGPHVSSP